MLALREIVADYKRNHRKNAIREQRWFEMQRDLSDAISRAALAVSPSGKRLSHQRRIPHSVLSESRKRLLASSTKLATAKNFEELHQLVDIEIGSILGIGELTIYDTALRIGAKLKLEPNVVFLHAGTRAGAKLLGLNIARKFIPVSEFPRTLQKLKPSEIEDILCIYKNFFNSIAMPNFPRRGCFSFIKNSQHRTQRQLVPFRQV